jgi:hypothetical protein
MKSCVQLCFQYQLALLQPGVLPVRGGDEVGRTVPRGVQVSAWRILPARPALHRVRAVELHGVRHHVRGRGGGADQIFLWNFL